MPTIPNLSNVRALVTGGAGFIGSHLVDALLEKGARVRILDNFSTGREENLAHCRKQVELMRGDIRDAGICRRACEGCDYIFHQAALGSVPRSIKDPAATISVNVAGTANVFAAARGARVRRVVYASSSSVYGDSRKLPRREGEEGRPLSPYALSKVMNEQLAEVFACAYGMELIGLRYFNVYGPRQDPNGPYAAVIPRFFRAAAAGEPMEIHGDGEQTRDFTFVKDAVRANLLAAVAPEEACGRAYNVGAGSATSIKELAARIGGLGKSSARPLHRPPRPGDVRHSLADIEAVSSALGLEPFCDLARGLTEMLDSFACSSHNFPAGSSFRQE